MQVPQFVLDAAIRDGRGAECNIVCTQPRRISAVGVASRVAQVAPSCPMHVLLMKSSTAYSTTSTL